MQISNPSTGIPGAKVGDYLEAHAPTTRGITSLTYAKIKEIRLARQGAHRIVFSLYDWDSGAEVIYGKIYKNGVAVGTERSVDQALTDFSEDIAGWEVDDLCQLYCKVSAVAGTQDVRAPGGFKVLTGNPLVSLVSLD